MRKLNHFTAAIVVKVTTIRRNGMPKKIAKKRDRKVMKYRHRQDWVIDVEKQRCRLSKVWRKMGADLDDGHLHSHTKDMVKSASFR
jgi:hypothetical protein